MSLGEVKRFEMNLSDQQGRPLYLQRWSTNQNQKPTMTILITHGMGEHSDAYERLIHGLAPLLNLEVFCWDLPGHGRSYGRRGVIENFQDYLNSWEFILKKVLSVKTAQPLFLLGHSMGGLITTLSYSRGSDRKSDWLKYINGIILSSPLFDLSLPVPILKEKVGRLVSKYLPSLTVFNEIRFEDLTRDQLVVSEYKKDQLRHDRISLSHFFEMRAAMKMALHSSGKNINKPFLLQTAGRDRIVSVEAQNIFFESVQAAEKTHLIYEDAYHEIYNDIIRTTAYKDLANWLLSIK